MYRVLRKLEFYGKFASSRASSDMLPVLSLACQYLHRVNSYT
jgi:hypothetical protein